jgi:hypothetical protein
VATDSMNARYDRLANSAGFQEGDRVWLYRRCSRHGKTYKVITRINDVYRIQCHPQSSMMEYTWTDCAPYLGLLGTRALRDQCSYYGFRSYATSVSCNVTMHSLNTVA